MNRKTRIISNLAVFCLGMYCLLLPQNVKAASPRDVLLESMQLSRHSTFSCDFTDSDILKQFYATKGKYYQLAAEDQFVFRRLELMDDKGEIVCEFVQNREGFFARCGDYCGKIGDIIYLFYFDDMFERISEPEESICMYSMASKVIDGQNYYEIVISSTTDATSIAKANPEFPLSSYDGSKEMTSPFYAMRPRQRIFHIGKKDGFLYGRKHVGYRRKLLYNRLITNIKFSHDLKEKDFVVHGRVTKDYILLMDEFVVPYMSKQYKSRLKLTSDSTYYRISAFSKAINWILYAQNTKWISIIMAGFAFSLLAFIYYLKRRD